MFNYKNILNISNIILDEISNPTISIQPTINIPYYNNEPEDDYGEENNIYYKYTKFFLNFSINYNISETENKIEIINKKYNLKTINVKLTQFVKKYKNKIYNKNIHKPKEIILPINKPKNGFILKIQNILSESGKLNLSNGFQLISLQRERDNEIKTRIEVISIISEFIILIDLNYVNNFENCGFQFSVFIESFNSTSLNIIKTNMFKLIINDELSSLFLETVDINDYFINKEI